MKRTKPAKWVKLVDCQYNEEGERLLTNTRLALMDIHTRTGNFPAKGFTRISVRPADLLSAQELLAQVVADAAISPKERFFRNLAQAKQKQDG